MKTKLNSVKLLSLFALSLLAGGASFAAEGKWVSLFDGQTLKGWKQLGGEAKFAVRDGMIVGTVTPGIGLNSFMTTEAVFEDFVFECEFKAADGINSGVQFRSAPPDEKTKKVHGYQCEIDPTPRGLTAGIYEESGRGWFVPTANHGEPQETWAKAHAGIYKFGAWNTLRIEARGAKIRTWLNGQPMSEYEDKSEQRIRRGFFGLQVHSTKNEKLYGLEVAFRNLRVQPLN